MEESLTLMLFMYITHATSFFMLWVLAMVLLTHTITVQSRLEADIGNIDTLFDPPSV